MGVLAVTAVLGVAFFIIVGLPSVLGDRGRVYRETAADIGTVVDSRGSTTRHAGSSGQESERASGAARGGGGLETIGAKKQGQPRGEAAQGLALRSSPYGPGTDRHHLLSYGRFRRCDRHHDLAV